MITRIQDMGNRFGWGSVVAIAPYINGVIVTTAGFVCYLLYVFFSLFGICPAPPSDSSNPISWLLYLLFMIVAGWWYWSMIVGYILLPVGAALSLSDLLYAKKSGSEEKMRGAIAGLFMTLIPIALWFQSPERASEWMLPSIAARLIHHAF
jgi:hypothetical protein